jgi:hypothetical protein
MKTVQQLTGTLTWTLDSGTLTISGTGAMPDYPSSYSPWYKRGNNITTVNIQDGVTTIGDNAFAGCSSLTSISIPDSVATIGGAAFSDCTSLTSITIPNSVTTIGECAFCRCNSLRDVVVLSTTPLAINSNPFYGAPLSSAILTVPNGCEEAYESAAGWNEFGTIIEMEPLGLLAWSYAAGVLTISGAGAMPADYGVQDFPWFYYRANITTVNIQDGVTTIGGYAFEGCWSLSSITIPDSVITIGMGAFDHCHSLTSITIPDSVTTIGECAFEDCVSLTSIAIPNSVTTIGDIAFAHCYSLTSITIPNSVTTIGDAAFSDCYSLTSVTIPNSVTTVGCFVFRNCDSLASITIGNLVTTIERGAFDGCSSLTSITIPNSITSIGEEAFRGCSSLRNIVLLRTTPPSITSGTANSDTFSDVPLRSATLTVPKGCKGDYKSKAGWKKFGTIVEAP